MTQAEALSIMKMGHNIFLTGSAGSGKTYVLNSYVQYLREHAIGVAITASTGIAATHMGGMTIHAWSGIGIRDYLSDYDIDQLETKKYLWDRFEKTSVLIIDETSMLSGTFLDNLDRLCRSMKRVHDEPFGGIQLILCGDLFQLPPISKGEDTDFIFYSQAWKASGLAICYITEQHRQNDMDFLEILQAIRENSITPNHVSLLEERIEEYDEDSFSSITKLFTHNADVDEINKRELGKLSSETYSFQMTATGKSSLIETLKKSCLAPEKLFLKEGAQVMFVKNNFDKGYVNGTRGIVVDFDDADMPIVKTLEGELINVSLEMWSIEDEGKVLASISQVPLRHAWAITVHKSQGMSLDSALIDLSKPFTYGMGYVALSRVRSLKGLHLVGLSEHALAVDPLILSLDASLQSLSAKTAKRLAELSPSEIQKSQEEFIIDSGGSIETVDISKKQNFLKESGGKPTHEVSIDMLNDGITIQNIAKERDLTVGTIISHLEKGKGLGLPVNLSLIIMNPDDIEAIKESFERNGFEKLSPAKKYLDRAGYNFSFETLKIARLLINA